jgi:hypothetical protein
MMSDDDVMLYDDEERLYHEMVKYFKYLAGKYGRKGHWSLNPDDLEAELWLMLARLFQKYKGKPYGDLLSLAKVSADNAIKSLYATAFGTYRRMEALVVSLDDDSNGSPENQSMWMPDAMTEAHARLDFQAHYASLESFDVAVLLAYAGRNEDVGELYRLYRERRLFVFKDADMSLKPRTVALALGCSVQDVEDSLERIYTEFESMD